MPPQKWGGIFFYFRFKIVSTTNLMAESSRLIATLLAQAQGMRYSGINIFNSGETYETN